MVRDRQKGRMSMDVKDTTYTGTLQISVVSALGMSPIPGATVTISYTGDPDSPIETLTTDESGQTPEINLKAPPKELSLTPDITEQPYSEYNIQVTAEGFETVLVSGSEILAGAYFITTDTNESIGCNRRGGEGGGDPATYLVWRISP